MNTIDLLDKLNLPTRIGLAGDEALFNRKTIMDAYLSAASLQFNRQLFGLESSLNSGANEKGQDSTLSLNQISADLHKPSATFDLFKMIGDDGAPLGESTDQNETKIVVDLLRLSENPLADLYEPTPAILNCQEASNSLGETESESYTKLEAEYSPPVKTSNKGKKKVDKSDISEIISEERRRLLKKLDSCTNDRTIFKRRVKNSKKDPKISADNYRGSKFWGVSKNKSKWQVSV